MSYVGVQTSSKLNQPIYVVDYSKPVIDVITEEVDIVKEGMEIISQRFNPFMKKTVYTIKRTAIIDYKSVGRFFDYVTAVRVAKRYARENNLKYEK